MQRVLILTADSGEELEVYYVSAFPPLAPDVEAAGGEFVAGRDVVDGNMVSATGWPDLAEWSKAFMGVLEHAPVPA
jgi:protease I